MFAKFLVVSSTLIALASSLIGADGSLDRLLSTKGKLIFQDDFDRAEADDTKEQLTGGWVTNSEKRAAGTKQADLKDGFLRITMAPHANHGVSVRHDAPFDDGLVQVKFRIHDQKGIGVNICTLYLPPRSKLSTPSTAGEPRRGITANKRFALRGLMNRKI